MHCVHWNASSALHHIVKGRFHGHPSSLFDHPKYKGKDLNSISIPAGASSTNLPIGLQLMAPPLEEERLLRAGRMFERESEWHLRSP